MWEAGLRGCFAPLEGRPRPGFVPDPLQPSSSAHPVPNVFISYRREDSAASAGRLFDRLSDRFGKEHVFRDLDAIAPGAEFGKVIAERIAHCDALIAVIGGE
jgi:TIR domain